MLAYINLSPQLTKRPGLTTKYGIILNRIKFIVPDVSWSHWKSTFDDVGFTSRDGGIIIKQLPDLPMGRNIGGPFTAADPQSTRRWTAVVEWGRK